MNLCIAGREVGPGCPALIIAEVAQAHDGSLGLAHAFIDAVAEGRALEPSTVQALADGRIFTGRQAKEAKLVDELGNLEDAIELAADLAGIEGEPKVVEPRRRFSIREFIESRLSRLFPKLDFYSGVSLKYLMAY